MTRELGPRDPSTALRRPHHAGRADRSAARRAHGRFAFHWDDDEGRLSSGRTRPAQGRALRL